MTGTRRTKAATAMAGTLLGAVLGVVLVACAPAGSAGDATHSTSTEPTSTEATTRLWRGIHDRDLAQVRAAVADGADVEARDGSGTPPVVAATKADRVDIVRVLLEAGASPDAKDGIQDSAFLYAGAEGLDDILTLTLEHGADVTSTNRYGGTALIPASEHGHVSTARILIDAGVPLDHVNNLDWTAMHEAIVLGTGSADHVEVVRMLLAAGADASIRDGGGVLPRDLAAQRGYTGIVEAIDRAAR